MELSARFLGFTAYGVQWVLWLLIALSVISIAMMLERVWHFATYHPSPQLLAKAIRQLLAAGSALRTGAAGPPTAESLDAAFEGAKVGERLRLERNLAFLGTLGSNAPFVGLFGTVLGIIKAFHDLAGNQGGGPAVVMAGISEALVATAVGLMVAIPAVVAFNYFNRRVRTIMTQVDWMAHLALAEIKASEAIGEGATTPSAGQPFVQAPLPIWSRRALPIAGMGVLLLIGGILIKRSSRDPAHALVPSMPPQSEPATPRTVMIPRSPEAIPEGPPAPTPPATAPPAVPATTPATAPAAAPAPALPVGKTPPLETAPATAPATAPLAKTPPAAPQNGVKPGAPQVGNKGPKFWKWKKRRPAGTGQPPKPADGAAAPAKSEDAAPASDAAPKAAEPATPAAPAVP